jgi:coproporphyrinogen III oxidase-like Fe-S oxidoreductase
MNLAALAQEFGAGAVGQAMAVVQRLEQDGLLQSDGKRVCLTTHGRLLSNEVFQEFIGMGVSAEAPTHAPQTV